MINNHLIYIYSGKYLYSIFTVKKLCSQLSGTTQENSHTDDQPYGINRGTTKTDMKHFIF